MSFFIKNLKEQFTYSAFVPTFTRDFPLAIAVDRRAEN
jgi:hypothetical protein